MKLNGTLLLGLVLATTQAWSAEPIVIKTDKDKLGYSIGASIGKNLKTENTDIDLNLLIEGLKAGLAGDKLLLTDIEIRQVMNDYQAKLRQKLLATKQQATIDNKRKGDAFLAEFKNQKDVLSLPGGVLYKVIKQGNGNKPAASDSVEVNYRGTLINGKEFDATKPGQPVTLNVGSVIAGWKQALSAMSTGSKWQIVIPPELAYGERGVGNDIGPNEVLVFEIELVAIK
jgi:FKBP-type peptidyl-prolyl cis-trans isomerase FklB